MTCLRAMARSDDVVQIFRSRMPRADPGLIVALALRSGLRLSPSFPAFRSPDDSFSSHMAYTALVVLLFHSLKQPVQD
jgi:hypothetical protein